MTPLANRPFLTPGAPFIGALPGGVTLLLQGRHVGVSSNRYGDGVSIDVKSLPWNCSYYSEKSVDSLPANYLDNSHKTMLAAQQAASDAQTARDAAKQAYKDATDDFADADTKLKQYAYSVGEAKSSLFTAEARLNFLTAEGRDTDDAAQALSQAQANEDQAESDYNDYQQNAWQTAQSNQYQKLTEWTKAIEKVQETQDVSYLAGEQYKSDQKAVADQQAGKAYNNNVYTSLDSQKLGYLYFQYVGASGDYSARFSDPSVDGMCLHLAGYSTTNYTIQYRWRVRLDMVGYQALLNTSKYKTSLPWNEVLTTFPDETVTQSGSGNCPSFDYSKTKTQEWSNDRSTTPLELNPKAGDFNPTEDGFYEWYSDAFDAAASAMPSTMFSITGGAALPILGIAYQHRGLARQIQGYAAFLQDANASGSTTRYLTVSASTNQQIAPAGVVYGGSVDFILPANGPSSARRPYAIKNSSSNNWGDALNFFAQETVDPALGSIADHAVIRGPTQIEWKSVPGLILTLGNTYSTGDLQAAVSAALAGPWVAASVGDDQGKVTRYTSPDGSLVLGQDVQYSLVFHDPDPRLHVNEGQDESDLTYRFERHVTDRTTNENTVTVEEVTEPDGYDNTAYNWQDLEGGGSNSRVWIVPIDGINPSPQSFAGVTFALVSTSGNDGNAG